MATHSDILKLEAVYYSSPVPQSKASLTAMALVFDRLHFPNVYLPDEGYDPAQVKAEAQRIEALRSRDLETALASGSLRILPHLPYLRTFCEFSGTKGQMFGGDLDRATELREDLHSAIFGPMPAGHIPTHITGFHKGLPGGGYVDFPDQLSYLANAIVYSADKGMPIVNDSMFPVLPLDTSVLKPELLASVLALKCVEFALPTIPPLSPAAIVQMREQLLPQLRQFRSAVARLAVTLNLMIDQDATSQDISAKADMLVRTEVAAALADLEASMKNPKVFTMENALVAGGLLIPVVSSESTSMPSLIATALAGFGALGMKIRKDKADVQRSGFYYLLRAKAVASR